MECSTQSGEVQELVRSSPTTVSINNNSSFARETKKVCMYVLCTDGLVSAITRLLLKYGTTMVLRSFIILIVYFCRERQIRVLLLYLFFNFFAMGCDTINVIQATRGEQSERV